MKIVIRKGQKIQLDGILFFLAMFCVFSFALLEHMSIPIPAFSMVKNPLLYFGGICILLNIWPLLKVLKKRKYFYVVLALLLFCGSLCLAVVFNSSPVIGNSPQRGTVRLLLYLVELFLLMIWAAESGRGQYTLSFLFYYLLILTVISDFLMFSRLIVFQPAREEYYLVGTKFTVAYFHINLFTFWFIRNRQRFYSDRKAKHVVYLGIPYVLFVSVYVDCMTGTIGCIVLLLMFILLNSPVEKRFLKLNSPMLLFGAILLSFLFPFLADVIISIPAASEFIQNILGKSANLTGRMDIYLSFAEKMQNHWLWGYGYGNANIVSSVLFGYANAQNGILQWLLQVGVPATLLLVGLMNTIIYQLNKSNAIKRCMPLILLVYLYIMLGTIEITYDMSFLLWFALIFMLSAENTGRSSAK